MFHDARFRLAALGRWPRLVLAGLCMVLAAGSAVSAHRAATHPHGRAVVVAARDLPAGHLLFAHDLRVARWPADLLPRRAYPAPHVLEGRRLAAPVSAAEPVTAPRLLGPALTTGLPARTLAVPVTVMGARVADLLRPGDRVTLLAVPAPAAEVVTGTAAGPHVVVVATGLRLLAVRRATDTTDLVVAGDERVAIRLAGVVSTQALAAVGEPP